MPLDPNAVPGLLRALDSDDVYVRIVAAEGLGKIGNPVAITRLVETLNDRHRTRDPCRCAGRARSDARPDRSRTVRAARRRVRAQAAEHLRRTASARGVAQHTPPSCIKSAKTAKKTRIQTRQNSDFLA